jgi:uncharacterized protein
MKKLISACLLSTVVLISCSNQFDNRSKIRVSGSAETEVVPDIIYFGISIREYFRGPGSQDKQDIESLEKQLRSAVLKAGISVSNFTINNVSSHNYEWERKKNPGFLMRKQYRIKLNNLDKIAAIIKALDPRSVEYTNVEGYDYSKLEAIKKDVKIKAVKAAKEKASYLAEAANSTLGKALEIDEINNSLYSHRQLGNMDGAVAEQAAAGVAHTDFKKIKLAYQVNMVFEIR